MSPDDKAALQLADLRKVLTRWAEAMPDVTTDERARDSAILRFELAFEVGWKLVQTLSRRNGLSAESPRAAFANAFQLGWASDEAAWADIIKTRNNAVHAYHEPLARQIAAELPRYLAAFNELAGACAQELGGESEKRE